MNEIIETVENMAGVVLLVLGSKLLRAIMLIVGWMVVIGLMLENGVDLLNTGSYGPGPWVWTLPFVIMIAVTSTTGCSRRRNND